MQLSRGGFTWGMILSVLLPLLKTRVQCWNVDTGRAGCLVVLLSGYPHRVSHAHISIRLFITTHFLKDNPPPPECGKKGRGERRATRNPQPRKNMNNYFFPPLYSLVMQLLRSRNHFPGMLIVIIIILNEKGWGHSTMTKNVESKRGGLVTPYLAVGYVENPGGRLVSHR